MEILCSDCAHPAFYSIPPRVLNLGGPQKVVLDGGPIYRATLLPPFGNHQKHPLTFLPYTTLPKFPVWPVQNCCFVNMVKLGGVYHRRRAVQGRRYSRWFRIVVYISTLRSSRVFHTHVLNLQQPKAV